MSTNFDYIVVGAGYAGLTAARQLLKVGKSWVEEEFTRGWVLCGCDANEMYQVIRRK